MCEMILQDVYYIPKLDGNLQSVPHLASKEFTISFGKTECHISKDNVLAALGYKRSSLYIFHAIPQVHETAHVVHGPLPYLNPNTALQAHMVKAAASKASLETWHQ